MIEAGVSVVSALTTLEQQTDDKLPAPGDRRGPLGRRGGNGAVEGVRPSSEGLQPAVRGDDRGGRVVRHPRQRARPHRDPDREGEHAQAPREERDGLPARRHDLRGARAHVHAHVHHPGLPERLRRAGRAAADADQDPHRHVAGAARLLVRHLPRDRPARVRVHALEAERARPAGVGQVQAPDPDACRRRRAQDRARPLLANALEPRHGRRRHHQGARDHGRHLRQLGDRALGEQRAGCACRRVCRSASRSPPTPPSRRW